MGKGKSSENARAPRTYEVAVQRTEVHLINVRVSAPDKAHAHELAESKVGDMELEGGDVKMRTTSRWVR